MTTKSMAYDNAAYQAVITSGGALVGATGRVGFVAWTTTLLKSVQLTAITAGTAADAKTLYIVRQGTATTTTALKTDTAAVGSINYAQTSTLSQGDAAYVAKGADLTEVGFASFELVLTPGASVTA